MSLPKAPRGSWLLVSLISFPLQCFVTFPNILMQGVFWDEYNARPGAPVLYKEKSNLPQHLLSSEEQHIYLKQCDIQWNLCPSLTTNDLNKGTPMMYLCPRVKSPELRFPIIPFEINGLSSFDNVRECLYGNEHNTPPAVKEFLFLN